MRVTAVVACEAEAPVAHGFVNRNRLMFEALRRAGHVVSVVGIAASPAVVGDDVTMPLVSPELLARPDGRLGKAARLVRLRMGRLGLGRSERRLRRAVEETSPDAILVLTLWRADFVWPLRGLAPIAFFAEERLGRSGGSRSGPMPPMLATGLRKAELASASRLPAVCILRADDVLWAQERFSSPVFVVPHGIDLAYWGAPGEGDRDAGAADVLVVANLTMERTAGPLCEVIDVLDRRGWPAGLRLRLVSAAGFAPSLTEREGPSVELTAGVEDPRPLYRSALATLVPAFEANGIKNGIIQGWASSVPVVTTPASATTTGGTDGVDLLVGEDPERLAALLVELAGGRPTEEIVAAGRRRLEESFGASAHDAALEGVLSVLRAAS